MFIEGTHDEEATNFAPIHSEIPYVTPQWEVVPRVRIPTNQWYVIPLPRLPIEVMIEGSMLNKIPDLTYADHDLHDLVKFPDFLASTLHAVYSNRGQKATWTSVSVVGFRFGEVAHHEPLIHSIFWMRAANYLLRKDPFELHPWRVFMARSKDLHRCWVDS